ncbi:MAG: MerR family transcriptional regulator [Candidatus Zixiibacteriota bacterium]|nr:MAG: MerR family transcriptional regulator [candidate division Zixibacteria bacterium]
MYYSISEVARMLDLEAYVLRFWEKEFPQLHPKKNRAGNRTYQRKDIEQLLQIKHLLYDRGFTIEGARNYLKSTRKDSKDKVKSEMALKLITEIRSEVEELLKLLP